MTVPLREIAAEAGVSAGLILHHFGSRAGLRAECDAHVLAQVRGAKTDVLVDRGAGALLYRMTQVEGFAPLVGYVLRLLQMGGETSRSFVDHVVADTIAYLTDAVEAGTIRPSRDPEGRARVLVEQGLGALLLRLPAHQEHLDLDGLSAGLRTYYETASLPLLELCTDGLLADRSLLEAYLSAAPEPTP